MNTSDGGVVDAAVVVVGGGGCGKLTTLDGAESTPVPRTEWSSVFVLSLSSKLPLFSIPKCAFDLMGIVTDCITSKCSSGRS